jgi:RNA polymerase-binding transcription factor DksA
MHRAHKLVEKTLICENCGEEISSARHPGRRLCDDCRDKMQREAKKKYEAATGVV